MLSRYSVRTPQGNELACNSSRNVRAQSYQFAEPLWPDPDLKELNRYRRTDLHLKNKIVEPSPQILGLKKREENTRQCALRECVLRGIFREVIASFGK